MTSEDYPFGEKAEINPEENQIANSHLLNESTPFCFGSAIGANQKLFAKSGRVLTSVGISTSSFKEARDQALEKVSDIHKEWQKSHWRTDIAEKVILEEQ